MALALYVASSVYISQAQEEGLTPTYIANIEFLFTAMEAVGRLHKITSNLLHQAIFDLRQTGLDYAIRLPKLDTYPDLQVTANGESGACCQVPLFARSRISKRTAGILPPLPGRLPLKKPIGRRLPARPQPVEMPNADSIWNAGPVPPAGTSTKEQEAMNANKRRRVDLSPDPSSVRSGTDTYPWSRQFAPAEEVPSSSSSETMPAGSSLSSATQKNADIFASVNLPHRGGSSTSASSPAAAAHSSVTPSSSSGTSPGQQVTLDQMGSATMFDGATVDAAAAANQASGVVLDMDMFQGLNDWNMAQDGAQDSSAAFAEVAAAMLNDGSWMLMNDTGINVQPWDTETGEAGVG